MEWIPAVTETVRTLSWPLALVTSALILRTPLSRLALSRTRQQNREKHGYFQEALRRLAEEVEKEGNLPPLDRSEMTPSEQRLIQLVSLSPKSAVFEAWLELDDAAREALTALKPVKELNEFRSPLRVGDSLFLANAFDPPRYHLFNMLRKLRNSAIHAEDIQTWEPEVLEYVRLSLRLIRYLENAEKAKKSVSYSS